MEAKKAPLTHNLGLADSSQPVREGLPRLCQDNELDSFDEAWQKGTPPHIPDYLPDVPPGPGAAGEAARRSILEGLINIDLEYRWRLASVGPVDSSHRPDSL